MLGLTRGEGEHALLAGAHEILDAVIANLALGPEPEALFHFHFHPQSLAIESVLIAQRLAVHGVVALVHVLERAAPGVMHAHGIVGGDGSVEERPARAVGVLRAQFVENAVLFPEAQDVALHGGKVGYSWHGPIHSLRSRRTEEWRKNAQMIDDSTGVKRRWCWMDPWSAADARVGLFGK